MTMPIIKFQANMVVARRFKSDGLIPNSKLPALIYCSAVDFRSADVKQAQKELTKTADDNEWYLDWVASVYKRVHYHSTAHEALVVFRGRGSLQLGGSRFGETYYIKGGDVVLIPAGVGHQRIRSTRDFTVFGLYPKGQKWDLRWGWRKEYASSLRRIKRVPPPKADPLFGKNGLWM